MSKNARYLQLMQELEEKERLLLQKEEEFKEEAYEEIRLSEERQAQADAKNRHLQDMLAKMERMEREFDALDADLDSQLHDMLKPLPDEPPGTETAIGGDGGANDAEGGN